MCAQFSAGHVSPTGRQGRLQRCAVLALCSSTTTAEPSTLMWSRKTRRSPCSAPIRVQMLRSGRHRQVRTAVVRARDARPNAWHWTRQRAPACAAARTPVQPAQVLLLASRQQLLAAIEDCAHVRLEQALVQDVLERPAQRQSQVSLAPIKLLGQPMLAMRQVGSQLQLLQRRSGGSEWRTRGPAPRTQQAANASRADQLRTLIRVLPSRL